MTYVSAHCETHLCTYPQWGYHFILTVTSYITCVISCCQQQLDVHHYTEMVSCPQSLCIWHNVNVTLCGCTLHSMHTVCGTLALYPNHGTMPLTYSTVTITCLAAHYHRQYTSSRVTSHQEGHATTTWCRPTPALLAPSVLSHGSITPCMFPPWWAHTHMCTTVSML